jgi:hypothetical protein
MAPSSVWYVAYGSNLARARFCCYLAGGRPAGGAREYEGARDRSEPRDDASTEAPGGLLFAGRSMVWGGGMAFYDHAASGTIACRAYLVTAEQFADVAAQEMRRPPGGEFAVELTGLLPDVASIITTGPGMYETIVRLGERHGAPMFTITHHDLASLPLASPSGRYLEWVARGLHEAHAWDETRIATYLEASPGVRDAWTVDALTALAGTALSPDRARGT